MLACLFVEAKDSFQGTRKNEKLLGESFLSWRKFPSDKAVSNPVLISTQHLKSWDKAVERKSVAFPTDFNLKKFSAVETGQSKVDSPFKEEAFKINLWQELCLSGKL